MKAPANTFDEDDCDDIPDNRPFKCTQPGCSYIGGKNLASLKTHEYYAHFGPDLQCSFCSYKTKHKNVLKCHINTHTGDMPFFCKTCGSSFPSPAGLRRHIVTNHPSSSSTLLKCQKCDYTSYWKRDIVEHMAVHGRSKFYCETCKLHFVGPSKLQRHNSSTRHQKAVQKMKQDNIEPENPINMVEPLSKPKSDKETSQSLSPPCGPSDQAIVAAMAATIPKRWKRLNRRIQRQKPFKSTTFKCQICTFKTDDVWSFTAHLRRLK